MSAVSHDVLPEQARLKLVEPALLRQAAYIDGKWGEGTATIAVRNPATGGLLGSGPALGAAETVTSVEAAQRVFAPWRAIGAPARAAKERMRVARPQRP